MIDLYYWTTPNGHKITIFLEETGLPYTLKPVNISKGEQFDPAFLAIAPNNRIPAIVDHAPADGGAPLSLMESGAILEYLATKTGQLLPQRFPRPLGMPAVAATGRWAISGRWPGRTITSRSTRRRRLPYAIDRYVRETGRLYRVLDRAPRRSRVHRRRLFDRRHRVLSVGAARAASRRTSTSSRTSSAGRRRSARGRRCSAPTRSAEDQREADVSDEKARAILFGQSKDSVR